MFRNTLNSNILIIISAMLATFFLFNMNIFNIQVKFEAFSLIKDIFLVGFFYIISFVSLYFIHYMIRK